MMLRFPNRLDRILLYSSLGKLREDAMLYPIR